MQFRLHPRPVAQPMGPGCWRDARPRETARALAAPALSVQQPPGHGCDEQGGDVAMAVTPVRQEVRGGEALDHTALAALVFEQRDGRSLGANGRAFASAIATRDSGGGFPGRTAGAGMVRGAAAGCAAPRGWLRTGGRVPGLANGARRMRVRLSGPIDAVPTGARRPTRGPLTSAAHRHAAECMSRRGRIRPHRAIANAAM
jgi:hypothetical protein